MAELAATVVHGNLVVTGGGIICEDQQVFKDEDTYNTYLSNGRQPDTADDEELRKKMFSFLGLTQDNTALIQSETECIIKSDGNINIGSTGENTTDSCITFEANKIYFKKSGDANPPSEYKIDNLVVKKAGSLTTTKALQFTDGYLQFNCNSILAGNASMTKSIKSGASGKNAPYLTVNGMDSQNCMIVKDNNNTIRGLSFTASTDASRIKLNKFILTGNNESGFLFSNGVEAFHATNNVLTLGLCHSVIIGHDLSKITLGTFNAKTLFDSKVPTTRLVNGNKLNKDITLVLNDILFYNNSLPESYETSGFPGIYYYNSKTKKKTPLKTTSSADKAQLEKDWNNLKNNIDHWMQHYLRNEAVKHYIGAGSKDLYFKSEAKARAYIKNRCANSKYTAPAKDLK